MLVDIEDTRDIRRILRLGIFICGAYIDEDGNAVIMYRFEKNSKVNCVVIIKSGKTKHINLNVMGNSNSSFPIELDEIEVRFGNCNKGGKRDDVLVSLYCVKVDDNYRKVTRIVISNTKI